MLTQYDISLKYRTLLKKGVNEYFSPDSWPVIVRLQDEE